MNTLLNLFSLVFTIILSILTTSSIAQDHISGVVLDIHGNPIEFVNVSLVDENKNLIKGTITDQNGAYSLIKDQSGTNLLLFQFIGYEDKTVEITGKLSRLIQDITLVEATTTLEEAVVTAERKVMERSGDKIIFNIASSNLKEGYDGIEVLAQTPSVWVDSEDGILMRNSSPMVLINGRPLKLTGQNLASYLRNIPSKNIISIEVQTTPGVESDANNLGGVINIKLKKDQLGFNSNLMLNLKSYGKRFYQLNPRFSFNYGVEKWNLYGSYNFSTRESNFKTTTDITYVDSEDYLLTKRTETFSNNRHNYQLGFVTNPFRNHLFGLEFFGNSYTYLIDIEGDLTLNNKELLLDTGILGGSSDLAYEIKNGVFNYTWTIDSLNSSLKLIADATMQKSIEDNLNSSDYENNIRNLTNNLESNLFNNNTDLYAFQTDLEKHLRNGIDLNAGIKIGLISRENDLLASTETFTNGESQLDERFSALDYKERISASYLSLSKKHAEKHFVKIGMRVENTNLNKKDLIANDTIKQDYTNWFPSFFYSYDLNNKNSISFNYSRRLSRPSFTFLNNNIYKVNDFRYFIGNPDLRPEYIDLFEIKVQKKKQSISLYYRQSNDAINGVYTVVDSIAYYQKKNDGQQKQIGFEYDNNFEINDWLSIRGSIHAYHRKFTNEEGINAFEQNTLSLRIFNNFKLSKTSSIELSFRYMSPTSDAFYLQDEFYYVNILWRNTFLKNRLNVNLYFDDVFNTIIWSNTRPFDEIITRSFEDPRSQTVRLSISYAFANRNKVKNRKNQSKNDARYRL